MGKSYTKKVAHFGDLMLHRLRANTHKGSWDDCDEDYLLGRLQQEMNELEAAVAPGDLGWKTLRHVIAIEHEAADVANFAMMIAERARQDLDPAGDGGDG